MASKPRVCFLRFVLYFVVGLLAFASKEASFLRDLDSSYTVSCVCTGLRVPTDWGKKIRHPMPKYLWMSLPGCCQIPFPVKIFCVFPNPENTLPDSDNTRLRVFLNCFKISDIDQLILALVFRFGVNWSKKLDVKFIRVFSRYKDTH